MLNSVHANIAMTLRPFSSALEMWLHLCNVSQQNNLARKFEVERNIAEYTWGDKNAKYVYGRAQGGVRRTKKDKDGTVLDETPS
ncbi:hypothetical protein KY290_031359 [Solanum tuberosum]|uniref:Uncharacterized protein n=1 Tax=Solanum tuberosum TaxID=4113 RepID=A0ABQ7U8X3_SOLTU|nr:hypothetical protein KY290_031359 [Solanum tuberosum]